LTVRDFKFGALIALVVALARLENKKVLRRLKNMAKAKPVKKGKKLGSVKPLNAFKR